MLQHKAATATMASYAASASGIVVGEWYADHMVQVVSIAFMALTFIAQVTFLVSRNRRERRSEARNEAVAARQIEIHDLELKKLKRIEGAVESVRDTLE